MESYVNVFKYGQSDYSYTGYLDCEGVEKDYYKDPDNVGPTFAVDWPGSSEAVSLSSVKITIHGGTSSNPINILSYSYSISEIDGSNLKELINSGAQTYRSPTLTKNISLSKFTLSSINNLLAIESFSSNIPTSICSVEI